MHKMQLPLIRLARAAAECDAAGMNNILLGNASLLSVHVRSKRVYVSLIGLLKPISCLL